MKNLGMIGVRSVHGAYLQAHTDGELHASNMHRNEEETWFLFEIDAGAHQYAFLNWRNGRFMGKTGGGPCVWAKVTAVGNNATWRLVNGTPYGMHNAVALQCVADGTYLGALAPGNDIDPCGGEVAAGDPSAPPPNTPMWPGWWVLSKATTPSPGQDAWNTIGGAFQNVANNLSPADVAALLALLA